MKLAKIAIYRAARPCVLRSKSHHQYPSARGNIQGVSTTLTVRPGGKYTRAALGGFPTGIVWIEEES